MRKKQKNDSLSQPSQPVHDHPSDFDITARIAEIEQMIDPKVRDVVERQFALFLESVRERREQERRRRVQESPRAYKRRVRQLEAAWAETDQAARLMFLQRAMKGCANTRGRPSRVRPQQTITTSRGTVEVLLADRQE